MTAIDEVGAVAHSGPVSASGPRRADPCPESGRDVPGDPLRRLRGSLASLQRAGSLAELLDVAPIAAAALGVDRVLLSRIDDALWVPERMYVHGDVRWAEEILDAGRSDCRRLDPSVLETRIVRTGLPLRVDDPTAEPLCHAGLVRASRTRSYVAVPIIMAQEVVGFLHADCHFQQRAPSADELEALAVLGLALGTCLDRRASHDRLEAAGRALGPPAAGFPTSVDAEPGTVPGSWSPPPVTGRRPVHELSGRVTRREAEVLALMCAGASNDQIARRLVITVGTVKSHVKAILRKLGAANRAEAVSSWLRSEYGRMSVSPPGPG
jgi:DNA-binding CsgD family transcriptional regulator